MSVSSWTVLELIDSLDEFSISSSIVDAILANLSVPSSEAVYGMTASDDESIPPMLSQDGVSYTLSQEAVYDQHGTESVASLSVASKTAEQRQPHGEIAHEDAASQREDCSTDGRVSVASSKGTGTSSSKASNVSSKASSKASNMSSKASKNSTSSSKRSFFSFKKKTTDGRPPRHDVIYEHNTPTVFHPRQSRNVVSLVDTLSTVETISTDDSSLHQVQVSKILEARRTSFHASKYSRT